MTSAAESSSTSAIEGFKSLGMFTADHAVVESGKVYANGAYWAALRFPAFPATLPSCSLVAVVQVPFHLMQSDHQLRFGLEDADGQPLPLEITGQFRTALGLEAKYGESGVSPFAVPIFGLTFERAGDYAFTFAIDGKPLDRYPFHVLQVAGVGAAIAAPPLPPNDI